MLGMPNFSLHLISMFILLWYMNRESLQQSELTDY